MAKKPIDETVANVAASTQNIAEVLATVTDLTRAARAAADLSIQLYAIATRIDDLLDRLAPETTDEPSRRRASADLSIQLSAIAERVDVLLDGLAPDTKRKPSSPRSSDSEPTK